MGINTATQIALGAALAGAIGFLVFTSRGDGVLEYLDADQVVEAPDRYMGRDIRVRGTVVEGTVVQKKNASGDYHFTIEHEGKQLFVHYTDMVPDTFMEGGQVVLTGQLTEDGSTIEATHMEAKCPSKYEEESGVIESSKNKSPKT